MGLNEKGSLRFSITYKFSLAGILHERGLRVRLRVRASFYVCLSARMCVSELGVEGAKVPLCA